MPQTKKPFYSYLWFAWLILTAIYFALPIPYDSLQAMPPIAGVIGLFVPIGPGTMIGVLLSAERLSPIAVVIPLALLVFSLFYADALAKKLKMETPARKIIFNLVWLMLLTLVTDYIYFGQWLSWCLVWSRQLC